MLSKGYVFPEMHIRVTTCILDHRGNGILPIDENILAICNAYDQLTVNSNSFLFHSFSGKRFTVGGALNIMGLINL